MSCSAKYLQIKEGNLIILFKNLVSCLCRLHFKATYSKCALEMVSQKLGNLIMLPKQMLRHCNKLSEKSKKGNKMIKKIHLFHSLVKSSDKNYFNVKKNLFLMYVMYGVSIAKS